MRAAAFGYLAGMVLTGAAIVIARQAPEFEAGLLAGQAAILAALVAIGPGQVGRFLIALADALQGVPAPNSDDFTELRAEVVAELVKAGVDYDDADAAVSQTARTGPADRRAWLKRSRALLNPAKIRRIG